MLKLSPYQLFFLIMSLIMVSAMYWSVWLMGLCSFLLWVGSLFDWEKFEPDIKGVKEYRYLIKRKQLLFLTGLFFTVFLSLVWNGDFQATLKQAQLKLPYLILPLAFLRAPTFSEKFKELFIHISVWIAFIFSLGVFVNFLLNASQLGEQIFVGQAIPTPLSHIRFSLIVTLTFLWGLLFILNRASKIWTPAILVLAILLSFLLFFLHFQAVKSGLMALYLGLFGIMIYMIYTKNWTRQLNYILIGCLAVLLLSVASLPTLRAKIQYTIYDWQQWSQLDNNNYSDVERFRSMYYGLQVIEHNAIKGIGWANLSDEMKSLYEKKHGNAQVYKLPHNQFIYLIVVLGIPFGVISILCLLAPYIVKDINNNPFLLVMGICFLSSCLVEATIQTSAGIHFHLLFTLMAVQFGKSAQEVPVNTY